MKREVIQDFLNLPGIAGVALMDGRSRPYFCGVDQTLNFQQKEALAQGLLQVIETIPDGFDAFEFQFAEHQVHLYKLDRGMVLLVLTCPSLVYADYLGSIKQLRVVLQEDSPNAIATFRLIAGNITLTGLTYRKHTADPATLADSIVTTDAQDDRSEPPPCPDPLPESAARVLSSPADPPTLKAAIAALNHLSQFTTQYLGTHVITNYWKATRPSADCLTNIQVDRSAQFSFAGALPQGTLTPLTPEEQQWLQAWVSAFIKRCAQVIRDFPVIVDQKALNDQQKALLLTPHP
ncbi:MAG: hypothetical protein KME42_28870 [Tildeniella nuda ZEHNDER 1965/U140]|jgi:hypothetical protein|nr:hypothetical protein [Tildeniella nuda ZEHNDER 1965/U140]